MEYSLHSLSVSVNRIIEDKEMISDAAEDNTIFIADELTVVNEKEIIRHETMHYQHLDPVWNLFRCLITAIYWFNPFVWLASFLSRQDAEYACALKIYGSFPMMVLVINGER